jgi:hypothetical protein
MTQFLDVFGLDASSDIVRTVVLALPVLVLPTLLVFLMLGRRRAKARARGTPLTAYEDRNVPPAPPAWPVVEYTPAPAGEVPQVTPNLELPQIEADSEVVPLIVNMPPAPQPVEAIESLQAALNQAMRSPPNATLAPLFLDMARHHKVAGDESSYLAALRSAAGLAAQHGPRAAHAEARLELAEAAFKSGDLIGACEQWQMARDALQDDGQKTAYAVVDKRMRDHGCPTDWVLTDF